jgi:hypothetical protein
MLLFHKLRYYKIKFRGKATGGENQRNTENYIPICPCSMTVTTHNANTCSYIPVLVTEELDEKLPGCYSSSAMSSYRIKFLSDSAIEQRPDVSHYKRLIP